MTWDEFPRPSGRIAGSSLEVRIRSATAADVPTLTRLHAHSQRVSYEPLYPELSFVYEPEAAAEARFAAELAATDQLALVAVRADGVAVGFALLRLDPAPDAYVRRLHVHPDAQGRGLGGALLESLIDLARARGRQHLVLNVLARNRRARDFYESAGWRRAGPAARRFLCGHDVGVVTYERHVSRIDGAARLGGRQREETS